MHLPHFFSGKQSIFFCLFILLLQSCANIVPPEGGKKDETPPLLLSITPADSLLQKKVSKITLRFNKYMEVKDLERNLQFSPLLRINPTVISYGKRIEIKIVDSLLEDNTTYKLSLGNALVDNREATPYKDFNFIFSTGAYFDSLKIHGRVFDAQTGKPDSSIMIMLYKASLSDSALLKEKPSYVQKTDASGNFSLSILPNRPFKIYAIEDINNNYMYDFGTEKVGFLDTSITPKTEDSIALVFHIFKETIDSTTSTTDTTKAEVEKGLKRFGKTEKKPENGQDYKVNVDTSNREQRSFDITQNLSIDLYKPISIDSSKIYLSFDDNGIEVEAVQELLVEQSKIQLKTNWQQDKIYTLRLVKGWAKDTSGAEIAPGKYFFKTKNKDDYGSLKIHMDSSYVGADFILTILQGTDSIFQKEISTNEFILPLLKQGDYILRIFKDDNKNGKWDPGNLFLKKHPEQVIPYPQTIAIKNGWENEIDFKSQSEMEAQPEGAPKKDRFEGKEEENQIK